MTIFQNVIFFFLAIATFSELQPHNLVMLFYISRCDFISLSYNFGSRNLLIYTLYIPQSEFKSRNVALFFLLYRFFPPELLLYLTIWRYISQFCFISCSVHLFFIKKKIHNLLIYVSHGDFISQNTSLWLFLTITTLYFANATISYSVTVFHCFKLYRKITYFKSDSNNYSVKY